MIKVGLIGENPSDTQAMEGLLKKFYPSVIYFPLIGGVINGSMLDNAKMHNRLRREIEDKSPDIVLYIRDLDRIETDTDFKIEVQRKKSGFSKIKRIINQKKNISRYDSLFLLNIYEIEALLLADLVSFNQYFDVELSIDCAPMLISDAKGFLKKNSKYKESDFEVFATLDIAVIRKNCDYFEKFIRNWEKSLNFHSSAN